MTNAIFPSTLIIRSTKIGRVGRAKTDTYNTVIHRHESYR
jgi:hypothetical protein